VRGRIVVDVNAGWTLGYRPFSFGSARTS